MKKKQLVPDKPWLWWRWNKDYGWSMVDVWVNREGLLRYGGGNGHEILNEEEWGGPVEPPKWTPKNPKCDSD